MQNGAGIAATQNRDNVGRCCGLLKNNSSTAAAAARFMTSLRPHGAENISAVTAAYINSENATDILGEQVNTATGSTGTRAL